METRMECVAFRPNTGVRVDMAVDQVGVTVSFGLWPRSHTTWHLADEGEWDEFVKHVIEADLDYRQRKKERKPSWI